MHQYFSKENLELQETYNFQGQIYKVENIWSCDTFRSITNKQKWLVVYNSVHKLYSYVLYMYTFFPSLWLIVETHLWENFHSLFSVFSTKWMWFYPFVLVDYLICNKILALRSVLGYETIQWFVKEVRKRFLGKKEKRKLAKGVNSLLVCVIGMS